MADRTTPTRTARGTDAPPEPGRRVQRVARALGRARPLARRALPWMLAGLVALLPCASWGIATASTDGTLGPHTARYEVTIDGEVTVDLGPLGTIVIESPVPVMGAHVVVKEIPRDMTAVEASQTLEALSRDLEDYIQFFNGPEAAIREAVHGLIADAARRTLGALVLVLGTGAGLRALLGAARRSELHEALRLHGTAVASVVVVVVLVTGTVTSSARLPDDVSVGATASSVFDGTPLEGARITGRLAGVIDTYGGYAVDAYKANEAFYATATANLEAAWLDRMDVEQSVGPVREDPADPPTSGPADEATDDEAPEDAPAPTAPEPVVILLVSDLHCNVGMAGPMRLVAELAEVSIVLNAGDTTVNGTVVESYCVSTFADAVPDGAELVAIMGNHDGTETADQMRAVGAHLLEGEVIELDGIRILGADDPRATRIGAGTTLTGSTTIGDLAVRLRDVACADEEGVDLLLVHDAATGQAALDSGCVPAQVSGHQHRRIGPLWVGEGTMYVSSSTAGAILDQPTVGPLSGTAEMTILRLDPGSGRVLDYRLIQVRPDASVSVGAALRWPTAPFLREPLTPYR